MIGVHDLGGMHHLGPVDPHCDPEDAPTFHAGWEGLVFALQVVGSASGQWVVDEYRHAIERMPPAEYLSTSYYEHWLAALEELLRRRGHITTEELTARQDEIRAGGTPQAPDPAPEAVDELRAAVTAVIRHGGSAIRDTGQRPAYAVGDRVIASARPVPGHTRCPRYVWEKPGTVVAWHGNHVFPDTVAHGRGENPEPLYSVRFDGRELWGGQAEADTSVTVDLWESYLRPAPLTDNT